MIAITRARVPALPVHLRFEWIVWSSATKELDPHISASFLVPLGDEARAQDPIGFAFA